MNRLSWSGGTFLLLLFSMGSVVHASCEINTDDNIVIDPSSGLMWSQCFSGRSGKQCQMGVAERLTWVDAVNRARGSEHANYQNWRLAKIEEIESLMEQCTKIQRLFPGMNDGYIWSATGNLDFNTKAWVFNLAEGKREKRVEIASEVSLSFY